MPMIPKVVKGSKECLVSFVGRDHSSEFASLSINPMKLTRILGISGLISFVGCGPSDTELHEDQFGVIKVENRKITGKEKTAKGNYFLKNGRKYCKLGVTAISPV